MPEDGTGEAIHVRVSGRVQGVGFRAFTVRAARDLDVVGRVRNLRDGSVEIRARGRRGELDQLLDAVRSGPPYSRVESVEEQPLADAPHWDGFRVER